MYSHRMTSYRSVGAPKKIIKKEMCTLCCEDRDELKFTSCKTCKNKICDTCVTKNFFKCAFCQHHMISGVLMTRPQTNISWDDDDD